MLKSAAPSDPGDRLRALVGDTLGLRIDDAAAESLEQLVRARMQARGRRDLERYRELLVASTAEAGELARGLCVNETYVLRNADQFRALARWLQARRDPTPPRMLSAGCSSGDEAFSLAIIARQVLPPQLASGTKIVGVDLDPDAIRAARAGYLSSWSLREVGAEVRAAYFGATSRGHAPAACVRELVEFRHENLVGPPTETWRPRSWDVVFCRNVLMYLTHAAACRLVARIADALVDGGLLFLGHAETLRGLSTEFDLRQQPGAFFYARRRRGARAVAGAEICAAPQGDEAVPEEPWFDTIARSSGRIEALLRREAGSASPSPAPVVAAPPAAVDRAMGLFRADKFADALEALEPASDLAASGGEAFMIHAVLLANAGRVDLAERACDAMLARSDLDPAAHHLKALCREHAGDLHGAVRHDRAAAYLDPAFAMPQLHAGLLLRRLGDLEAASATLRAASRLLQHEDDQRIVLFGGGFGREALVELCRAELRACGGPRAHE